MPKSQTEIIQNSKTGCKYGIKADCKSAGLRLRWFESITYHHFMNLSLPGFRPPLLNLNRNLNPIPPSSCRQTTKTFTRATPPAFDGINGVRYFHVVVLCLQGVLNSCIARRTSVTPSPTDGSTRISRSRCISISSLSSRITNASTG